MILIVLKKIQVYEYDCVLLDITLPNGNGLDLIKLLKIAGQNRNYYYFKKFIDKIDGLNLELMITCQNPFIYRNLMLKLIRRNFDGVDVMQ
jgi:DNA-binding response OmpR family regulator